MVDDTAPVNPLLAGMKNVPGLSILLPTKGLLYKSGELSEAALESGEIHVHPMSAKDELMLKSPDLLMSGEAIRRVVKRCIPDVNEPLELFQPDMDAILVAIRLVTYGELLPIKVDNPYYNSKKKGSQQELEFQVNLKEQLQGGNYLSLSKDCVVDLEFEGPEGITKQKVTCQPIRFKMTLNLASDDLAMLPQDDAEKVLVFQKRMRTYEDLMLSMINDVDGISDREMIREWYENIPAGIFATLSERVEELSALGPKMITTLMDPISGKSWECTVPINPADFFATGPSSKTGEK
jgi:hypothetical protein